MTLYRLELIPEPQIFSWIKRPYDKEFYKILRAAAERCLRFMTRYGNALITDKKVVLLDPDSPIEFNMLSYFTAYANYYWNDRNRLLVFSGTPDQWLLDKYTTEYFLAEIQRSSRASYEMYVEDCRASLAGGLFPDYTILPYEKTPKFYREGIWLKDERILP
jgi:hypothetical protein